jgi:hypothetical protein
LIRQLAVLALAVVYDLWSEAVAGIVAIVGHVVAVLVVIGLSATLLSVRQNRSRAVDAYTVGRDLPKSSRHNSGLSGSILVDIVS